MVQSKFVKLFSLLMLLVFTNACGPGFQVLPQGSANGAAGGNPAVVASTPLAITPAVESLAPGHLLQFEATGGATPYVYAVTSGLGDIDSGTGLFLSSSTEGNVQITVTDAAGAKAIASIAVTSSVVADPGSVLTTSWYPNPVQPGDTVYLSVSGGTAPYTFQLVQGTGTLSGNQYIASSTQEAVLIQVTDSNSNNGRIAFTAGGTTNVSVPGISVAAINIYYPGSTNTQCGGSGTLSGQVAWMAGKHYGWAGEVQLCETTQTTSSAESIVSDLVMTGDNHYRGAYYCPSGYTNLGSVVDCRGGFCQGAQTFCGKLSSPANASTFVTDFYITPEGKRAASGSALCSSGYTSIGEVADCGGGACSGVQQVCVKKQ